VTDRTIAGVQPGGEAEAGRPRRPAWLKAAVGAFLAFELVAAAVLLGGKDRTDGTAPPAPRPAAARPRAEAPRADAVRERADAVRRLLDTRARAITRRDRHTFARTLDRTRPRFVQSQLAMFDALAAVPVSAWHYDLHDDGDVTPTTYGVEAWAPRVTLRYRLTGFDDEPPAVPQFFTFTRRDGGWVTASDSDYDTDPHRRTGRELWDFGPVAVARGSRSLVLGRPGQATLLRDVARLADAAVPRVTKVWGTRWSQRVVILVPSSQREVSRILGDDTDLSRIAAVAVAELPGDTGERAVGNRIIVNPQTFRRLGTNGRRVVLTHETAHVATRDASRPGIPTWLVEGFADYVGYLGTGLSPRAICQELAADVRAGRAPVNLPADDAFSGANDHLAQAYESSWLAVRMIAERVGEQGLVRFYDAAGRDGAETAMREALGTTPDTFVRAWRNYLRTTLG
jgi:hypothetical protein